MKKRSTMLFICSLLLLANIQVALSQEDAKVKRAIKGKETYSQDELVSFKSDIPYKQALESLSALSKKFSKKPIVDPQPLATTINVEIQSLYWRDALELILRTNNLWYTEADDYFQVSPVGQIAQSGAPTPGGMVAAVDSGMIVAKSRVVTISAIFLEINTVKLRESGLNFNIFRGKDLNLGVQFSAADNVSNNIFGATVSPSSKNLTVNIDAAIKIFESEQIGEVIARPQTVIRSGNKGRLQVGTDFSIKERDFSGNVIDRFYSTGTILEVTPKVYSYGTTSLIDLPYRATRSTVSPGQISTLINKSEGEGRLVLLDGEESYVGGLYVNDETTVRTGIPILKDLPWWFFGLRYIFGYDKLEVTRKDLIILMKAELVPTIEDRLKEVGKDRNTLQDKLKEIREDSDKRLKKQ
jgi:type IV pilus assembly protein PilQ